MLIDRRRVAELGNQNRCSANLPVATHAGVVDVLAARRSSIEVEVPTTVLGALQVRRRLLQPGCIHTWTKVDRRGPREIVVRVCAPRDIDVQVALPSRAVALEEQQMSIDGNSWSRFHSGGIYRCEIEGLGPGTIDAGSPRNPD